MIGVYNTELQRYILRTSYKNQNKNNTCLFKIFNKYTYKSKENVKICLYSHYTLSYKTQKPWRNSKVLLH